MPGILVMPPAFLATRGGVYGSLGSGLSSGLHQGLIEPRFVLDRRLTNAIVASFVNGMVVSAFIAVMAIRRRDDWLLTPGGDSALQAGNVLIGRGPEEGAELIRELLAG